MVKEKQRSTGLLILGVIDALFGALGLLASLGILVFVLLLGGGGLTAVMEAGPGLLPDAPMVVGLLVFVLFFFNALLLTLAGAGLIAGQRWGLYTALGWGGLNVILCLGFVLLLTSLTFISGAAASPAAAGGSFLIYLAVSLPSLILAGANCGAGVSALMRAGPAAADYADDFSLPTDYGGGGPGTTTSTTTLHDVTPKDGLDDVTAELTRQAERKISLQVYLNGRAKEEISLRVRDAFGKPVRNIVGRGSDCNVILPLPSVSAHHCCITEDKHGNLIVDDLQSSHGTYVERGRGQKRRLSGTATLYSGDRIYCGPYAQIILTVHQPSAMVLKT